MTLILTENLQILAQRRKRNAFILTFFVFIALFLLLYFTRILLPQQTVPFEYGMAVTYGQDESGSGSAEIPIENITTEKEELTDAPSKSKTTSDENIDEASQSKLSETNIPPKQEKASLKNEEKKKENKNEKKKVQGNDGKNTGKGQGNDTDKSGNKGKPTGIDKKGLYDGQGGTGASLNISGWRWETAPVINDNSKETGKITLRIKVDEQGYVISADPIAPTTVSASIVQVYEKEVMGLIFIPTADNANPAPVSTGTITFIIKSK